MNARAQRGEVERSAWYPPNIRARGVVTTLSPTGQRSAFALLLALATSAFVGCGDDAGDGGAAGHGADGGSPCGPDETESPNGVCIENVPCGDDIPTFKIGLTAEGRDGNYSASLVNAKPSPPRQYFNEWVVDFLDAKGTPADGIGIDKSRTWMPEHLHDGYVTPVWTEADEPGRFSGKKLNMWMPGPWEVQINVSGPEGSDYIEFSVCVTK